MSALIQTCIALVVLYILFSIINGIIMDGLARWFKLRANFLKNALQDLFEEEFNLESKPIDVNTSGVEVHGGVGKQTAPKVETVKTITDYQNSGWYAAFSFLPKMRSSGKPKKGFLNEMYDALPLRKMGVFNNGSVERIEPRLFAEGLIHALGPIKDKIPNTKADLTNLIEANRSLTSEMREFLQQLLSYVNEQAGGEVAQFRDQIQDWYEIYTKKAEESYRNNIRKYLFVLGLGLAMALNLDTLYLGQYFFQNPEARANYVALGETIATDSIKVNSDSLLSYIEKNRKNLEANGLMENLLTHATAGSDSLTYDDTYRLPVGIGKWNDHRLLNADGSKSSGIYKLLGFLITALALSFGSPYWFDVLRKVIKLQ